MFVPSSLPAAAATAFPIELMMLVPFPFKPSLADCTVTTAPVMAFVEKVKVNGIDPAQCLHLNVSLLHPVICSQRGKTMPQIPPCSYWPGW